MDPSCSLLNQTDSLLKHFKVLSQRAVIVILGTTCKEEVSLDNPEAGFSCRGMISFCCCFLAQAGPAQSPSPTPCATLHPSAPEGAQGHARRALHFINARKTAPAVGLQLARAPRAGIRALAAPAAADMHSSEPSEHHPALGVDLSWGLRTLQKGQKGVTALSCVPGNSQLLSQARIVMGLTKNPDNKLWRAQES